MSEYQCYEFVALDHPLTPQQMGQLRAISTRAEISTTRFWNEYHWGDPLDASTSLALRARADELRAARQAKAAAERSRAQAAAARARAKQLDQLAERWQAAWLKLDKLIDGREYAKATALAIDLRDLAQRDGKSAEFEARFEALKKVHARRRGFFDAYKRGAP